MSAHQELQLLAVIYPLAPGSLSLVVLWSDSVSDCSRGVVRHVLQAGVLPVVHGSALGQQGLSQELVTSTIGDDGSAAKSEGITGETRQQLMVQLNTRVAAATEVQPSSSACYKCTAPGISIPQIDLEPLVQVFSGFLVQAQRQ